MQQMLSHNDLCVPYVGGSEVAIESVVNTEVAIDS